MSYKNNRIPQHVIGNSNILPQSHANQSMFNLSEDLKTTMKFDYCVPIYWEELNPGDKFEVSTKTLARLMPMVAPTMSNIKLKYFSFFVPNRLLWKNWTKFMGEKVFQDDTNDYLVPQVNVKTEGHVVGGIADYMGICPTAKVVDHSVSALPFRAYNKIWNEWFRAKEIQEPIPEISDDRSDYYGLAIGNGTDGTGIYKLRKKGKPLDYFTSCLPYPQAGEPVTIPLTGNASVMTEPNVLTHINAEINGTVAYGHFQDPSSPNNLHFYKDDLDPTKTQTTNLYADMSQVTGVSIEMLRKASALQVLLEKDARAGESYIELMNVHYGTSVPDFLVGRSQYLGSSTTMINVEPIAQTGGTSDLSPQGNLSGVGIGADGQDLCEISAVEHGIFMIIACVDGEISYSQGLPRKFSKLARYDYMFPEFHNLGDQAVLNKEIYVTADEKVNNSVFGYQERYRELRESTNKLSGLMRTNVPNSLDVWHLGQRFGSLPTLSAEFIECNTPIDRVLSVPSEDHLILNVYFDIKATRTLPVSSNPSLLAGRV